MLSAACAAFGGACVPITKGHESSDSGVFDAGLVADASLSLEHDAGVGPDVGDAGLGFDAGLGPDAGVGDAGTDETLGYLVGGPGPWPGPISGVAYQSGALHGVTDAVGTFRRSAGEAVVFGVGDVTFAPVPAAAASRVTPWQLAEGQTCTHTAELDKVLVLLFSLDDDGDWANGVQVPPGLSGQSLSVSLSSLSLAEVAARLTGWRVGPVTTVPVALDAMIRQVDDETWAEARVDAFGGATALRRGQGVATDGTSWFFSGTASLERTDDQFNTLDSNSLAIPLALALKGSDHIGDIDVLGDTLYAPIEDGRTHYANPKVVTFGASSLSAQTTYSVSNTLQTQGVPWVAVSGPRHEAYLAEWDPTSQLNIFTLATLEFSRALPLTLAAGTSLGRVQGGKVFESALYLATDDAVKGVYKVDLETGTVLRVMSVDTTGEQEGLAFRALSDGTLLHTLNVNAARNGSEFRHHRRTRDPLRHLVCH